MLKRRIQALKVKLTDTHWLQDRYPESYEKLAQWLGDRPDIQLSAYGASLGLHVLILLVIALVGVAGSEGVKVIQAAMVDTAVADLDRLDATELAVTDAPTTLDPVLGSFAPHLSPRIVENPLERKLEVEPVGLTPQIALPTAVRLNTKISIKGDGAEHVEGVEGAVDRIALEILRRMEKERTLVIWAFDASGSLYYERQRLAEHIEQVYEHVIEKDRRRLTETGGLLTSVVAFGEGRKVMTDEPTNDPAEIIRAIRAVPLDETGIESTFQTVIDIVRRFGNFKLEGKAYRPMIIVVTDEIGDDEEKLETAIASARKADAPVYVLGSPALFGRVEGYMSYTDPKTEKFYPRLPVKLGPESVMIEQIRLPFWYDGPQYTQLDAGFGPWALSRLAGTTGGIYFVTRMGENQASFDPAGMREYRPDWVSKAQYQNAVSKNPLRQAVLLAAQITQQNLPGQPGLSFPTAGTPEFKQAMERNQEIVARVIYTVDEALEPINAAVHYRDRETSRRWQAHYDLIRARLLAMKIRCFEYNWACAQMKSDPKTFSNPKSNAWRLTPENTIHYSPKAAEAGAEAEALLKRVLTEHPGTPWALLAHRELKDPFGFKWVETYVPPPPPRNNNNAGNNNRRNPPSNNNAKPEPLPKL